MVQHSLPELGSSKNDAEFYKKLWESAKKDYTNLLEETELVQKMHEETVERLKGIIEGLKANN